MKAYYFNFTRNVWSASNATITRNGHLSKKPGVTHFTDRLAINKVITNNPASIRNQCMKMREHNTRFAQCYVGGETCDSSMALKHQPLVGYLTIQARQGDNEFMVISPNGTRFPFEPLREHCTLVFTMAEYKGKVTGACEVRQWCP
tara:strand:+ start:63 stop:500 length:438 start_codon:yes stop_codon:yes gene_type:complete